MFTQPNDSTEKASTSHLNHQIGQYSLAAAMAGVSMLALAQPAAAEVVITKKTIPIPLMLPGSQSVELSMANNGIDNFAFRLSGSFDRALNVFGESGGSGRRADAVVCGGAFYGKALALPRGTKVGPNDQCFSNYFLLIEATDKQSFGTYSRGYWGGNVEDRYLGVRFPIDGETHYGWIRLTVTEDTQLHHPTLSAKITAYAYETVANKAILTGTAVETSGKPSAEVQLPEDIAPENLQNHTGPSLGMLALGAHGVPQWRREKALALK